MIERTGRPSLVTCQFRVPLSESPSAAWRAAFQRAVRAKHGTWGGAVTLVDAEIHFACPDGQIVQTLADVDRCIDVANGLRAAPQAVTRPDKEVHRELTWRERRAINDAVDEAESLRDE
jgi:hypothetical protein